MFSTPADLGIVAYALVKADGTTPDLNSGVTVTHPATGEFQITLPGDPGQQEPLQEGQGGPGTPASPVRDLILVTPYHTPNITYTVSEPSAFVKQINLFTNAGAPFDASFFLLILRSLISPPMDGQGNYIAPA